MPRPCLSIAHVELKELPLLLWAVGGSLRSTRRVGERSGLGKPIVSVLSGEEDFDDFSGVRDHQLDLPSLDFCDGLAVHAEPDDLVLSVALKRFGDGCARKPPTVIVVVELAQKNSGMARAAG